MGKSDTEKVALPTEIRHLGTLSEGLPAYAGFALVPNWSTERRGSNKEYSVAEGRRSTNDHIDRNSSIIAGPIN